MNDGNNFWLRIGLSLIIYPAVAIVFYGTARLIAMAIARWMPESRLKRRLLTDTDTGRLAYVPKGAEVRSESLSEPVALLGRDKR